MEAKAAFPDRNRTRANSKKTVGIGDIGRRNTASRLQEKVRILSSQRERRDYRDQSNQRDSRYHRDYGSNDRKDRKEKYESRSPRKVQESRKKNLRAVQFLLNKDNDNSIEEEEKRYRSSQYITHKGMIDKRNRTLHDRT